MFALDGPPQVTEDRLRGEWSGAPGILRLDANLRYDFSPALDPDRPPAILGGHRGRWRVVEKSVVLQPDSPSALPITLRLAPDGKAIVLEAPTGRLRRGGAVEGG